MRAIQGHRTGAAMPVNVSRQSPAAVARARGQCMQQVLAGSLVWPAPLAGVGKRAMAKLRSSSAVAAPTAVDADAESPGTISTDDEAELGRTKIVVFSSANYVRDFLSGPFSKYFKDFTFVEATLDKESSLLAQGYEVAVLFVNDICNAEVVENLAKGGVKLIAMRCAGYDRVDLTACAKHGIKVVRVPTYSPESVAEHAVALMFALNRNLHTAYVRVQQGNYALSGLVGKEINKKTVGVVGTGAIGVEACRILKGIGCRVIAHDIRPNPKVTAMGIEYMSVEEMLPQCDVVTLHCPLLPSTYHLINRDRIALMKPGCILINVSRGGLVESEALFEGLESGRLGAAGLDVYENEGDLFFRDFTSLDMRQRMRTWDRNFRLLLSYPQVLVTPHSAFLTHEALNNIASTTLDNIIAFKLGRPLANEVKSS